MTPAKAILTNRLTRICIARGAPGVNPDTVLDVSADVPYSMGTFEENLGEITRRFEKDPNTLVMRPAGYLRGNPEAITTTLSLTMRAYSQLDRLGPHDKFNLTLENVVSGNVRNPLNYDRRTRFLDVLLETRSIDGDAANRDTVQGDEEDTVMSANINAGAIVIQLPLNGTVVSTSVAAVADCSFRDAYLYDDGTDIHLYAITDVDPTGTTSLILHATVDRVTGDIGTWDSNTLTGYTTGKDADFVVRSGDTVIVGSNAGVQVSYADVSDLSSWTTDTSTFASDGPQAAAVPFDGFIVIVCDGGAVFESTDGGLSYTKTVTGGDLTSEDMLSVAFVNGNIGYAGGANGALLKYVNGDWSLLTDPTSGADINAIAIPKGRPDDVYIGCSDATIWHSHIAAIPNVAASWTQYRYPGDSGGAVTDLIFTEEWYGPSMFIVHTAAGGQSRVLRDLSGGYGGNNMTEAVSGAGTTTNSGFAKILAPDSNLAIAFGNDHSSAEMVMKILWK